MIFTYINGVKLDALTLLRFLFRELLIVASVKFF